MAETDVDSFFCSGELGADGYCSTCSPRPPMDVDLQLHAAALVEARAGMQTAVDRARGDGASWTAIGKALGVTRQAAWERFAGGEAR